MIAPPTTALPNRKRADEPVTLIGFSHEDNQGLVRLKLSCPSYRAAQTSFPQWAQIEVSDYLSRIGGRFIDADANGEVVIRLEEEHYLQSTIILIEKIGGSSEDNPYYIEFLRQSAHSLKGGFEYTKDDGYTILGRTNLDLPNSESLVPTDNSCLRPLSRALPSFPGFEGAASLPRAMAEAVAISAYIWSQPVRKGPSHNLKDSSACPLRMLDWIHAGKELAQCGDIINIFLNLAANSDAVTGVRYIGAFRHRPPFPDLTPYSHALAEIHVAEWKRWILIDVWCGLLFHSDGRLLGVSDVLEMEDFRRPMIEVVRLLSGLPDPFVKKALIPGGYWQYFGKVLVGPDEREIALRGPDEWENDLRVLRQNYWGI